MIIQSYSELNVESSYKEIANSTCLYRDDRELVKTLKPLLANCNIVTSNSEQQLFLNNVI